MLVSTVPREEDLLQILTFFKKEEKIKGFLEPYSKII
jgi:hypothetical protein